MSFGSCLKPGSSHTIAFCKCIIFKILPYSALVFKIMLPLFFFFFFFEDLVKSFSSPVEEAPESWFKISDAKTLESLMSSLTKKGIRESRLLASIKKISEGFRSSLDTKYVKFFYFVI